MYFIVIIDRSNEHDENLGDYTQTKEPIQTRRLSHESIYGLGLTMMYKLQNVRSYNNLILKTQQLCIKNLMHFGTDLFLTNSSNLVRTTYQPVHYCIVMYLIKFRPQNTNIKRRLYNSVHAYDFGLDCLDQFIIDIFLVSSNNKQNLINTLEVF